jgi:predicted dinucleotide-binding enzyme
MKVAVVGRGNVGGGLADLWESAGHEVTRLGKDGGDVSDADAVLLAVPGGAVADALDVVRGIDGKTVIDATNLIGAEPPSGFQSNAEFVKSRTNGPTAKSFNLNFARVYDQIGSQRARPCNIWTGDEEAKDAVEQLIRDAGYDPVYAGGLESASLQESAIRFFFGINQGGLGPFFYRFAPPGEL